MAEQRLVHNVFFALKDGTPAAIEHLTNECYRWLSGHPGEVFFAAGPPVPDLVREVNDRDFHVALTVVFDSKASHDVYQTAPRHLEFIAGNKPTWAKVRVFDNYAPR